MELQKTTGFLKNAYYNGHGRYVNQVIRLTLKFCKSAGGSRELRKFIETRLVDVARENPGCVIYVKPRMMKSPVMTAEYLNGAKHYVGFHRFSCQNIEDWVKWYLTRSGHELHRLNRPITTYRASTQGIWTPFKFKDPTSIHQEFPSEELSRHIPRFPTATQQLEEIAKKYGFQPISQVEEEIGGQVKQ